MVISQPLGRMRILRKLLQLLVAAVFLGLWQHLSSLCLCLHSCLLPVCLSSCGILFPVCVSKYSPYTVLLS